MDSLYKWAISNTGLRPDVNNAEKVKVHRQLESGKALETVNGLFCLLGGTRPTVLGVLVSVLTLRCLLPQPVCFVSVHGKE